MEIFTGSYNNNRGIADPVGIGISAGVPHWFYGPVYKKVAPPWELINKYKGGHISSSEYIDIYHAYLNQNKITPEVIISDLQKYGDSIILLCWERKDNFCHRMILAKMLMSSELVNPIKELG